MEWSDVERAVAEFTCKDCDAGKYSSATGATLETECNGCPPGKASSETGNTKASNCIKCTGNTVAGESGMTECETPANGSVVLSGGAAAVSKYFHLHSFVFCLLFHNLKLL